MFEFCRVFSDTMFSRLTIDVLLGYLMCIFFIVQCSKKKKEKTLASRASKSKHMLPVTVTELGQDLQADPETRGNDLKKQKHKNPGDKSGKDALKSRSKVKSVDSGPGGKKSKMNRASRRKSDRSQSSANKDSKPMDGTQNGATPNDPTGNASENEYSIIIADACDPMEDTIDDPETPAIHDRVIRVAATDMIFDPKLVAYKGNVDMDKDPKEVEELEKEMQAACEKHEARFKDVRKNDEKNPNSRLPKSAESERSTIKKQTPVPADLRVKMRPDQCVLYETKEQITEDDQEEEAAQGQEPA